MPTAAARALWRERQPEPLRRRVTAARDARPRRRVEAARVQRIPLGDVHPAAGPAVRVDGETRRLVAVDAQLAEWRDGAEIDDEAERAIDAQRGGAGVAIEPVPGVRG